MFSSQNEVQTVSRKTQSCHVSLAVLLWKSYCNKKSNSELQSVSRFLLSCFFLLRKKEPVLGREKLLPVFPAPGSETSLHYSKHQCHLWVGVLFLHKNISVKPVQRDLVILKRTSFKKTVSSQSNSSVLALRSSVACQNTDLFLNSLFVVYHLYIERNIVLLVSQHGTFAWIFCVSL